MQSSDFGGVAHRGPRTTFLRALVLLAVSEQQAGCPATPTAPWEGGEQEGRWKSWLDQAVRAGPGRLWRESSPVGWRRSWPCASRVPGIGWWGGGLPRTEVQQGDGQRMHWSSGFCVYPRAATHLSRDLRLSVNLCATASPSAGCTKRSL